MSTNIFNSHSVAVADDADPASEEDAFEMIAVPNANGNDDVENAAASTDAGSNNISSDAAADDAGQQRTTFVKRGGSLVMAAAALGALAVIGAGSVHLAGRPMTNFSSSKQVAVSSEDIEGFTLVGGGQCQDEPNENGATRAYDYVKYVNVADAKKCAKQCSKCPGGGQTDDDGNDGVKLVLRGFEYYGGRGSCVCLVEDGAEFTKDVCEGADDAEDGNAGSGEIQSSIGLFGECWKIKSKSSKSPKSGSKGGKRG